MTAVRLYSDLRTAGVQPWLDLAELVPGTEWQPAIRSAMREASHIIVLMSARSGSKTGFVQHELRHALDLASSRPPDVPFVIPVRLDESVPKHEQLMRLHWVDLFVDYAAGLARLLGLFDTAPVPKHRARSAGQSGKRRVRALEALAVAVRRSSHWQWSSVALNDLLPECDDLEARLESAGVRVGAKFGSRHGSTQPAYRVVTIGPGVAMTAVRHVLELLPANAGWYVHITDDPTARERIAVGAYGYGGSAVAPLSAELKRSLGHTHFTMQLLRVWLSAERHILQADYPIEDTD